jgi:outer membrane lipoprotein-sorting protein
MKTFENNHWLDDILVKAIISQKPSPDFEKWQRAHPQAVQTLKSQATRKPHPRRLLDLGRIIMRSPITKLAIAATIIIAVFAGIYFITGKPPAVTCCAWAQIADKVAQFKTCVYSQHIQQSGGTIGQKGQQFEAKIYISSDYGYKSETTIDGKMFQSYMNPGKKVMIMLMPSEKKYMRMVLTDEMLGQMEKEMQDPRDMVTKFMSGPYKELGKDTINGVEVKGIEVNNPPAVQNIYNNFIGRMWVDVATEYPVRMEIEGEIGTGAQKINMVSVADDFEWGVELSPDLFKPDIPADFTMTAEVNIPNRDETGAIDGLKYFSELINGRYPDSMNDMSVTQEPMKVLTQSIQQSIQQSLVKDMNLADMGAKPSEAMRQELIDKAKKLSEPMQQELMYKIMKLKGPVFFYTKLAQDGNDPAYFGKDVTPGDANAVLMRWKVSDDAYRVIYGDLTVENVSAEQLKEMEQPAQQ